MCQIDVEQIVQIMYFISLKNLVQMVESLCELKFSKSHLCHE